MNDNEVKRQNKILSITSQKNYPNDYWNVPDPSEYWNASNECGLVSIKKFYHYNNWLYPSFLQVTVAGFISITPEECKMTVRNGKRIMTTASTTDKINQHKMP